MVFCDKLFRQKKLKRERLFWLTGLGSGHHDGEAEAAGAEGSCSHHRASLGASRGRRRHTSTQFVCFVLCHPAYHSQGRGPAHIISTIKITPHRHSQTHLADSVRWTVNIKHCLCISIIFCLALLLSLKQESLQRD